MSASSLGGRFRQRNARDGSGGYARPEALESRVLLSAIAWTGSGGDFEWNNAANWDMNRVPAIVTDNVMIPPGVGAPVRFSGGRANVASIRALSLVEVAGGALGIAGESLLAGGLNVSGGSLSAGRLSRIVGPLTWSAGALHGSEFLSSDLRLVGADVKSLGCRLSIEPGGRAEWTAGDMVLNNGTIVVGARSILRIRSGVSILDGGGLSSVLSGGDIELTGAGAVSIDVAFGQSDPDADVLVKRGTLRLLAGGAQRGDFHVDAGAGLVFGGGRFNFDPTASIDGPGGLTLAGGDFGGLHRLDLTGPVSVAGGRLSLASMAARAVDVSGGSLEITGSGIRLARVSLAGGTLQLPAGAAIETLDLAGGAARASGRGAVTISGEFRWHGGTLGSVGNDLGRYVLAASGELRASGPAASNRLEATLAVGGVAGWAEGSGLAIGAGGRLAIEAGGVLRTAEGFGALDRGAGFESITNDGTMVVLGCATIEPLLVNSGGIDVRSGSLVLDRARGGGLKSLASPPAPGAFSSAGVLLDSGRIAIHEGASLSASGDLLRPQMPSGGEEVKLIIGNAEDDGPTLRVTGSLTLWGVLEVEYAAGYTPRPGDSATLVSADRLLGDFTWLMPDPTSSARVAVERNESGLEFRAVERTDWNLRDGTDSQDYFDFLEAYFASVDADFNADGAMTTADFSAFLVAFGGLTR